MRISNIFFWYLLFLDAKENRKVVEICYAFAVGSFVSLNQRSHTYNIKCINHELDANVNKMIFEKQMEQEIKSGK